MSKEKTNKENVQNEKKKCSKFTSMGIGTGMCLGLAVGMSIGLAAFDNISLGMCFGMSIGMCIGIVFGSNKDKIVNAQLEEKGYTISEITEDPDKNGFCIVKVVDKNGEELTQSLHDKVVKSERFEVGDLVFLEESGNITQVLEK